MEDVEDTSTTAPRQSLPCDPDDQLSPPMSPAKPEVDMHSQTRELPETGADASSVGVTCDDPMSPIGASSEKTSPAYVTGSPYQFIESSQDVAATASSSSSSSSCFGESHVNRLQSFVDSMATGDDATATTSWSRGRPVCSEPSYLPPPRAAGTVRKTYSDAHHATTSRLPATSTDEPLDLSVKSTTRRPDHVSSVGEIPFPVVPVVPPLFPLLACRESWIAQWAALATASLQHSLLFPALSGIDTSSGQKTTSGPGWMTSSSPRSSSSSSSAGNNNNMADERRRSTALTAMESFVESSFKTRQQQQRRLHPTSSAMHDQSTNRKRRRHHYGAEMTSSGDEDGNGPREAEKRKRSRDVVGGGAKGQSVSLHSDDQEQRHDDASEHRSPLSSLSKPEVNGESGYLSCNTQYDAAADEHPLVSLEKFVGVGVAAPLFPSSAVPPCSAGLSNGISSPLCRTPGMPDGKTPGSDDATVTSFTGEDSPPKSRSIRSDVASSGSLHGRGFAPAQSLLCCNL